MSYFLEHIPHNVAYAPLYVWLNHPHTVSVQAIPVELQAAGRGAEDR